jgi:hypothetical protein
MYLSASFTVKEFEKSATAIRRGIDNTMPPSAIENAKQLCKNVLQPVRNRWSLPVTITSGYRSANLNHAMGGAQTSQHLLGMAADIEIAGVRNDDVFKYIRDNLEFDQLIAEYLTKEDPSAGWIHVSYNAKGNRKQVLSCVGASDYRPGLHYVD